MQPCSCCEVQVDEKLRVICIRFLVVDAANDTCTLLLIHLGTCPVLSHPLEGPECSVRGVYNMLMCCMGIVLACTMHPRGPRRTTVPFRHGFNPAMTRWRFGRCMDLDIAAMVSKECFQYRRWPSEQGFFPVRNKSCQLIHYDVQSILMGVVNICYRGYSACAIIRPHLWSGSS